MVDFRQRLLATSLLVGVSVLATPAYGQTVPPPQPTPPTDTTQPSGPVAAQPTPATNAQGAPVTSGNEIIVTGSRIPQPNLTSAAPVTVVSNQDVKLSGATRVEDVLNSLPSVSASQSSYVSNGATGAATVDLRNLGSKRTLVLINGRRLMPGDPNSTSQAADLNVIPSSLIKRVEVLTGGASSVYGADAVAGVVNFLMDTEFTGIRLDGTYSFWQHNNNCPSLHSPFNAADDNTVCAVNQDRINQGLNGYAFPRGSVAGGGAFDGTISLGAKFDDGRGHAMAYFGYRKVQPVLQSRRDYGACALNGTSSNTVTCGGSGTNAAGRIHIFVPDASFLRSSRERKAGIGSAVTRGLRPGGLANSSPAFNFNPYNYYQRPDERYIGGAFANYEVDDAIKPYLEFMFMDDHTLAQIAPSGDFGNTLQINCDNPFLSTAPGTGLNGLSAHDTVCNANNLIVGSSGGFPVAAGASYAPSLGFPAGTLPQSFFDSSGVIYNNAFFQLQRRNVEGGPRISDLTHTNFRGVLGTRGDLSKVWSYDAYFQYGRTNYTQVYKNEFSTARLNNALNVVLVDPITHQEVAPGTPGGVPTCRSVLAGTDLNCVPYDIFTTGTPSAAAVNYLNVFGVIEGKTNEQIADLNFTGALGEMGVQTPWSDEGVGINVGAEYRKESLDLNPDQEFQQGDLTGQGAPTLPVSGAFRVLEVFGETQIPIIKNSFIDELSLAAGYRKSWYQTNPASNLVDSFGNPVVSRRYSTDTYKLSAEFAPVKDIRFRGAYNRAVRAPNIQELFAPTFVGLDATNDPCADNKTPVVTATDYGCIAQGMPVGSSTPANPANQYNGLLGGNPNLNPEKATTKTLGVVLQPRFIPRFAATIDYYDIKIDGAIQGFGANAILSNCVGNATATFTPASCALIHRDPGGSIWLTSAGFVRDLPQNVGGVETKGFDTTAAYSHRFGGIGNLSFSFLGTLLRHYVVDDGLNPRYDCAGFYGSTCGALGGPQPKWRHKLRTTLQMPNGIGVSLQWRYVGKVAHEGLNPSPVFAGLGVPSIERHVKAQNYFDLATTFDIGDHYALRLGVNNILDRNPPIFTSGNGACGSGCNGNVYGGTYDSLGRYVYAGATLNF